MSQMKSKFQESIIEDINETGEVSFALLIPIFLEKERSINIKYPIFDYFENYEISDENFKVLQNQLIELFSELNLGLYKYHGKVDGSVKEEKWEDSFNLLNENEKDQVFSNKDFFIYKKENPAFFIAEKE